MGAVGAVPTKIWVQHLPEELHGQDRRHAGSTVFYCGHIANAPTEKDECPDCGKGPHDTMHLFECSARPTTLDAVCLWTQPEAVASFLGLLGETDDAD